MTDETTWRLLALLALLGFSGFFSGSETALLSLDKLRQLHCIMKLLLKMKLKKL